jgi:hypothetical protein
MNNWTEKETIVAFNLYCKLPFGKLNQYNPEIIKLAELLGRNPSAVNMKLCNMARLDPSLQKRGVAGLTHGAKLEQIVWDKFVDNPDELAYQSEKLIAEFSHKNIEEVAGLDISKLPDGKERESIVKVRVNQSFFRDVVLNSYDHCCCISGVANDKLLEASHIIDWSDDVKNRTNPWIGPITIYAFYQGITLQWSPRSCRITIEWCFWIFFPVIKNRIEISSMSWSTAFPARTIIIILRGVLMCCTKSLISVQPMIFFPLPRPFTNRSTTPSSIPGTVRLYTATVKPLLSIFKTRFSPITASPIKPISAFLSIINILKFILIMIRVVLNIYNNALQIYILCLILQT